ncbi:MAG TPA: GPW/gp25 family protein [Roseomonas sp.]|jgi:phage baseplate assembly protein W
MALSAGRHLAFPFRIGPDGRTASPASDAEHVRDELLQLLLTDPGERPFLVEFGGGVRKLVFEPASDVLRGVVKARITQALSRWLGNRLTVERLEVEFTDALIEVTIQFRPAGSTDSRIAKFQRREA